MGPTYPGDLPAHVSDGLPFALWSQFFRLIPEAIR